MWKSLFDKWFVYPDSNMPWDKFVEGMGWKKKKSGNAMVNAIHKDIRKNRR